MKKISLVFLLPCLALGACHESPVLNHVVRESKSVAPKKVVIASETPADCELSFPNAGFCGQILWENGPQTDDESRFVLRSWKMGAQTFADFNYTLKVKLWMPSMGHGSSPVKIRDRGDGTYKISDVYFTMPGHWQIRITLTDKDGRKIDEVSHSLTL